MSKNAKIEIRISEDIKTNLQEKAKQNDITVSELIRREIYKILGKENEQCEEKI